MRTIAGVVLRAARPACRRARRVAARAGGGEAYASRASRAGQARKHAAGAGRRFTCRGRGGTPDEHGPSSGRRRASLWPLVLLSLAVGAFMMFSRGRDETKLRSACIEVFRQALGSHTTE